MSEAIIQEKTEELIRRLRVIESAVQRLAGTLRLDVLMEAIIGEVTEAVQAESSTLYTVDKEGNIHFSYIYGADPETREKLLKFILKPGQGIVGSVVQTGEGEFIADAQQDERHYKGVGHVIGKATRSMMCVPLKFQGKVVGAIQVINRKNDGPPFTREDYRILELIASVAGVSLNNATLFEDSEYLRNFNEYIIENIHEVVYVVDRDLKIIYCNSALEVMTGGRLTREDMIGQNVFSDNLLSYLTEELREKYAEVFRTGLPERKISNRLEYTFIPIKGKNKEVQQVLTVMNYRRG